MEALRPADPRVIGGYQILARLGSGGMGEVFLGLDPRGGHVAVKVIRADFEGAEALSRFRHEVETVGAVRSRYTAALAAAELAVKPYWLATEYIAGPTLGRLVAERGALPVDELSRLAAGLAAAVADVHAHGVLHRDLKPQNVILAADGPRLIDFGIARGAEQTVLTVAGTVVGTPGYLAPELVQGAPASAASDVFALGALLAHAATGRQPFGGGDPQAVLFRTVGQPIDLAGVEPAAARMIEWCVAKDPADRPTAARFLAGLGVAAEELPTRAFYQALGALADTPPVNVPAAVTAGYRTDLPATGPLPPGRRRFGRGPTLALSGVALAGLAAGIVLSLPDAGSGGPHGASQKPAGAPSGGAFPGATGGPSQSSATGGGDTAAPNPGGAPTTFLNTLSDINTVRWDPKTMTCGQVAYGEELSSTVELDAPRDPADGSAGPLELGWRFKSSPQPDYYVEPVLIVPKLYYGNSGVVSYRARTPVPPSGVDWSYFHFPTDFIHNGFDPSDGHDPVSQNKHGDWTVLWYHVLPDGHTKLVACDGFTVK